MNLRVQLALPLCRHWGPGHSACSTNGGCRGSFDLVLLFVRLMKLVHLGHLGSGQWGVELLRYKGNHGSWVKCATFAEC
jgi:hypothetical protein